MQGHTGICSADLPNQQSPIWSVGKPDCDHTLLPAVCQEDGLRGLDNGVAVCGVHLFCDVCPRFEPCPDGSSILAGDLRTNHGTAGAAGSAQIFHLECASWQGLPGHTVVLLNDYRVERHVFIGNCFAFAALDIKFLGCRFLDGKACGRFQLSDLIPAVPQIINDNLAVFIGEECTQAVQLTGGRVVGTVPDLELGSLDGAAGDAVHLIDGQGGLFVVLKIDRPVPVGVECHQLRRGVCQPGGGNGFLAYLIHAGQQIFKDSLAVCAGFDLVDTVAVRRFHQKNGVGNGLAGVRVPLVDGQIRTAVVFNHQSACLTGEELHMVFPKVHNVVAQSGCFADGVHTGLQVRNQDFSLFVRGAVQIVGPVLNLGNAERHALQPGAV